MPLLKRKAFVHLEPPEDLKPRELVYQVRFTKEIFRDYQEYLNRINFYRKRVWTCKVTGKGNLTFEEALVSEKHAIEKVKQFPKQWMKPVLQIVQFSTLRLQDLVNTIRSTVQEQLVGVELSGKKDNCVLPCKIMKVVKSDDKTQYEVAWLDSDKNITSQTLINEDDLIRERLPLSRNILKSFIRESTCQSSPWVLHDKLAQKYGIPTIVPEELKSKFILRDGHFAPNKRRKIEDGGEKNGGRKKVKGDDAKKVDPPVKGPVDDLLLPSAADDSFLRRRPSPSRVFIVSMDCVGDLLMVWDFFSSFGRMLNLSPFSLDDFEKAVCYKDSNPVLIVESHSSILRLLIKEGCDYFSAIQGKQQKSKITLVTWVDYISDFLEMIDIPDLSSCIATIKRGHYSSLDVHVKLGILRELVSQALSTDLFRDKLDKIIEQRSALASTRREGVREETRKKKEDLQCLKAEEPDDLIQGLESLENNSIENNNHEPNGDAAEKTQKHESKKGEDKHAKELEKEMRNKEQANGDAAEKIQKHESRKSEEKHAKALEKEKWSKEQPNGDAVEKIQKHAWRKSEEKHDTESEKEKLSKEQRNAYFERELAKLTIRSSPLGKDRHYNRYWFFRRDGRIFVESSDFTQWGYYSAEEEVDALMKSLNCKGVREKALHAQLTKYHNVICLEMKRRFRKTPQKAEIDEAGLRRSTRVRAPPRKNPALAFLKYENKWKEG